MIVSGRGYRQPQQVLVFVHSLDHRAQKQQELGVLIGGLAGGQQVHAGVRGDGPVVVLAAAVDPGKGLFVEQADQIVPFRYPLHDLHGQLVVVRGDVGGGIDGGQLVLSRGDLVVFRLGQDAQLPQLDVQLVHVSLDPGPNGAEILVIQLLSLGWLGAVKGPARDQQVLALLISVLVHQKVFLLRPHGGAHPLDVLVAEQLQDPHGLPVQGLHGPQKRRLFVQSFAAVGAEGCWDAQGLALDKGIAGGVPGGVAPGLIGCPQPAGGEAGGVRLALDQLLAGELHDHPSVRGGGNEAVVLFRRDAGQGLEPVGEVGCAQGNGPVPHGGCHRVCDRQVQSHALVDGPFQRLIHVRRKIRLHHSVVEDQTAKIFRYRCHFVHPFRKNKKRHRRAENSSAASVPFTGHNIHPGTGSVKSVFEKIFAVDKPGQGVYHSPRERGCSFGKGMPFSR